MSSKMSVPKSNNKKRKITEGRSFSERWTNDYFFVPIKNNATCLMCNKVITQKEHNVKLEKFEMHNNGWGKKYDGQEEGSCSTYERKGTGGKRRATNAISLHNSPTSFMWKSPQLKACDECGCIKCEFC